MNPIKLIFLAIVSVAVVACGGGHDLPGVVGETATGSLDTKGCVIPKSGSSCTAYISYSVSFASEPRLIVGTTLISTARGMLDLSVTVGNGKTSVFLYNNKELTDLLNRDAVVATCESGSTWDGNVCKSNPM